MRPQQKPNVGSQLVHKTMKCPRKQIKMIVLSSLAILSLEAIATGLETGDKVVVEAIGEAHFIQGVAPDKWEAGKLYVLECWATWCAPCVAAIPHVDGLYDKYRKNGLVVIGMNVKEEGREIVAKFVEKKGEGMSYPVAYVGRGGAFEQEWLRRAGVNGIPHAFLVKDGKLLLQTHPMRLTSEVVEGLLKGGAEQDAVLAKLRKAAENRDPMQEAANEGTEAAKAREAFVTALKAKDVAAMETVIVELRTLDPEDPYLGWMAVEVAFLKKDWIAAKKLLEAECDRTPEFALDRIAKEIVLKLDEVDGISPELLKFLAAKMADFKGDPVFANLQVARLQAKAGSKKEALLAAKATVAEVRKAGKLPVEPFEAFVHSIEDGEPLTFQGVLEYVSEATEGKRKAKKDE